MRLGARALAPWLGAVLLVSAPARADEAARAESLFQQGVAAMERGELSSACGMLAESQRLDPGGGTLLNLALCNERAGRVATAWAQYREALGVARRDRRADRITFAETHLRALEPRLPRLAVVLADGESEPRVKLDGIELRGGAWEIPAPVDPGAHELRVEARARRAYVTKVVLAEGESRRVVVPALEPEPVVAAAPLVDPPPAAATPAPALQMPEREAPQPRGGTQRVLGWTFTGVGGAGLVATAILGSLAIGAESTADAACPAAGACTDPRGIDASERASSFASAATITGIAGLALLTGGIVLLLTAPR